MPSKFRLRKIFAPVVKLLAKGFMKLGVSPNLATCLMLLCAISAFLGLVLYENLIWFGIWIFVTGLMDGVDGAIARISGKGSKFGAFFDSTMDRVSEVVLYSAILIKATLLFVFSPFITSFLIWCTILTSMMISYSRARLELVGISEGIKFDSNIGLLARSERLFYLFLLSILSNIFGNLFFSNGFVFYVILTTITFLTRLLKYRKYLSEI